MTTIVNTVLSENRGKPRVWLEGEKLAREGLEVGMTFDIEIKHSKFILRPTENGKYTVSKRTRNGLVHPLIELTNEELREVFKGVEMLRVAIHKGKIIISEHHMTKRIAERVKRLVRKVKANKPLDIMSLYHGGGGLDLSLHDGMAQAGIKSQIALAIEMESTYLDSSLRNNPQLFSSNSLIIESKIQSVNYYKEGKQCDGAYLGIPCNASSRSGRSKNGTWGDTKGKFVESHDEAGTLFYQAMMLIDQANVAYVVIENVPEYAQSASADIIRSLLTSWGYKFQEAELCGTDFGSLEKRTRWCLVAVTEGLEIGDLDLSNLQSMHTKPEKISDIFQDEPLSQDDWKRYEYLADKAERDAKAGKGFKRQLLTGNEPHCGTLGKGYKKARSTEPFILHRDFKDNGLQRLFTEIEHCRLKRFPESFIANNSATRSHEILGQSVVYSVFFAVGYALGKAIRNDGQIDLSLAA
ncbi:DNA methyltransferase [Vibrio genomosp. F10 str. ZF-129]|uniref:DNA (cytosine-5-)-methyltransferase n=1 Tax=Vibrio genomosp. F10 str. ZF-129 TaxID=1187848 RepID=A0A1E5BJU2_9VIBR|nr:DNA cytosine methyltransferase [Vibrio genomosp. F10]OEE37327.1 DNA methyltransferase [Vibrio genomosp. F10 str. ZF-129]